MSTKTGVFGSHQKSINADGSDAAKQWWPILFLENYLPAEFSFNPDPTHHFCHFEVLLKILVGSDVFDKGWRLTQEVDFQEQDWALMQ